MRKLLATLAMTLIASLALALPAFAETINSNASWTVAYTSDSKMVSNFNSNDIADEVGGLQAGDTINLAVSLKNDNAQATYWYMTNRILSSLEDSANSAAGGAYTYRLVYIDPAGQSQVLFASDTVGGDESPANREGLREATSALEDYFLLGTLDPGQGAKVTLAVTLDGETQGNAYQDTLAELALDFAVEPVTGDPGQSRPTPSPSTLPQTGDMLKLAPLFAICGVAGLVMLIAGIFGYRARRKQEEEVS